MADKTGTLQDRGDMRFQDKPLGSPGLCPFKGADIAIVPVRYALDRSRHDPDPTALKPLPKDGVWTDLPDLISRKYTLRQLYDGYVYVFDETAKTFHEYRYSVSDSLLCRVKWLEQDIGQDQRTTMTGESKVFLLYPRTHTLHIGYSPKQWTWRICEHMRSNPDSRALWMKALDLNGYCRTMAERDTYPLDQMAEAVADVDHDKACTDDQRFADSAIPTFAVDDDDTAFAGTAADSYWLARVSDQLSSLIIALDDPLAVLNDLGTQLTNDQVVYGQWQNEHEHKSQMAQTVTALCGAASDPDKLPASVKDDPVRARKYLRDLDDYFTARSYEEASEIPQGDAYMGYASNFKAAQKLQQLVSYYGSKPTEDDYNAWEDRWKWRKEIDLVGAHAYLIEHQAAGEKLLQQVRDTQEDLRTWAEHIGTEPMKLFIDTNNPKTLLYLMSIMATLQTIISKDIATSAWLAEEEIEARSLFGLITFGFSAALKDALGKHANELIGGISDQANVASRAGELNGALNHEGFANAPWMLALKQSTRDTFKALNDVAKGEGKAVIESILLALVPSNSRLSSGKQQNLPALLRNMLIDQVLLSASDKIGIDNNIHKKLGQWKRQWQILNKQIKETNHLWTYQTAYGSRAGISGRLQELKAKLQLHELSRPSILDYQNNQYADQLRAKMKEFAASGADVAKEWHGKAKEWSQQLGGIATAVTYGVIMLNFLNTALTYRDLTRDGEFSKADMVKVTYNLGYSASLLMAVFVNAPWQVVKAAEPAKVAGKLTGILERSSAFWRAQGKPAWADAVLGFRRIMAGVGSFAILATALEFMELMDDLDKAKSSIEKNMIITKIVAVGVMGIGGVAQLASTLILSDSIAFAVMSPWFAVAMAVVGVIYLIASFVLNYLRQDNVGWWLRKSCWSKSEEHRHSNTLGEKLEESRSFTEIQLSPQIFVKCTMRSGPNPNSYSGLGTTFIKNGAWIQIRLPKVLRSHLIQVNVAVSKRALPIFPVELTDEPVQKAFEENGQFVSVEKLGNVSNNPYRFDPNLWSYPAMPPGNEDVIWQTWVPFSHDADFLELQIWYPNTVQVENKEVRGYLYQISLEEASQTTSDGSSNTELSIRNKKRVGAIRLAVAE